jgi:hypothetical protein
MVGAVGALMVASYGVGAALCLVAVVAVDATTGVRHDEHPFDAQ